MLSPGINNHGTVKPLFRTFSEELWCGEMWWTTFLEAWNGVSVGTAHMGEGGGAQKEVEPNQREVEPT